MTTRRVIVAGGVINKWQRDTSLPMINDMVVDHPLLGRVLGYGEIDLLTASEQGTERSATCRKRTSSKRRSSTRSTSTSSRSAAAGPPQWHRLLPARPRRPGTHDRAGGGRSVTRLAAMRDRGVITAAEIEEKKRELLAASD